MVDWGIRKIIPPLTFFKFYVNISFSQLLVLHKLIKKINITNLNPSIVYIYLSLSPFFFFLEFTPSNSKSLLNIGLTPVKIEETIWDAKYITQVSCMQANALSNVLSLQHLFLHPMFFLVCVLY